MFVIILVVSLLSIAALAAVGCIRFLKRPESDSQAGEAWLQRRPDELTVPQVVGGICLPGLCLLLVVITSALWVGLNVSSTAEVASMEAFYYETIGAYEYTISRTGDVEISAAQPGLIDVAYFGQAEIVGLRILELRDEVTHFNRRLRWYRTFGDNPIASSFLADPPADMRPITITELADLREARP